MKNRARVAISADFLQAFAQLPKAQQKKVREFTEKFREDPLQTSIHYERIHDMRDDKVRTVRIGDSYRAIVVHPPAGDVYLLAWVDRHDDAMAWAKNKVFEVNPVVGSLQVYEVGEATAAPQEAPARLAPSAQSNDRVPRDRLLAGTPHADLLLCGVPAPLLPAVRAMRIERDLDELAPHLPPEAADALYMLVAGGSVDEALKEAGRNRTASKVDTDDFAAALAKPESLRRFNVVDSERQLKEMLGAPLEQWRTFLHPSQQALVRMRANGPVRVLGGPGTGKTVAALHRARFLAAEVFAGKEDRVLFTTFTKNLTKDIERQLRSLCDDATFARIEVVNVHQWASRFLRAQKVKLDVVTKEQERDLWDGAIPASSKSSLPPAFYKDEWRDIVQAQGITEPDPYLRAKRTGRGTALSRAQRLHVWDVMSRYRAALDAHGKMDLDDVLREAALFLTLHQGRGLLPYRAVVADEVQDLGAPELRLLRAIVPPGPEDLFLVGDAHQRIYRGAVSLGLCGIETRGRSCRLKINYRTTKEVRDWAVAIVANRKVDDLDDGEDSLAGYRSLRSGTAPTVRQFRTPEEESRFILATVGAWRKTGKTEEICIAARTHRQIHEVYEPMLRAADVPTLVLDKDAEDAAQPGVRLATMHRFKGLEFPRVLLVGVQDGAIPLLLPKAELYDAATTEEHLEQERRLLFVAATRARDELVVTGYGKPSSFFEPSP